ncbi:MAG: hypothetical protein PHQ05_10235 [Sterolibacterium sp.]|nr:hypothetical protein [Sterolibacterium sp.]
MKSSAQEIIPALGTPMEGGFFGGCINIDGKRFGLAVAPKAEGQHKPTLWIQRYKEVPGAKSYYDGLANTLAMARAGSKLAQWALDLRIAGHDDWYLLAQDEKEIIYRAFKPTTAQNSLYSRSGINVSAIVPTCPYTRDTPAQTAIEAFQAGGAEAFDEDYYWTSTQHAAYSVFAWCQDFGDGYQGTSNTSLKLRARAVRRFLLSNSSL